MSVEVYLSEEKIQARIKELGAMINQEYAGEEVFVIGVLNGAFMFAADLIRQLTVPVTIEFMSASSYGDGTESSGELKINLDLKKFKYYYNKNLTNLGVVANCYKKIAKSLPQSFDCTR